MAGRVRDADWGATPLGPSAAWPGVLRLAARLMLDSRFPMFIAWGAEGTMLYNDAYAVILGPRHPSALGRPLFAVWPELREALEPLVARVRAGEAVYCEDLPLTLERRGDPEQTFFTFSYSPLRDEDGSVAGLFCACTETTRRVQAEAGLRAGEERIRAILASIADGFFALDQAYRFTYLNPEAERILGIRAEDLLGREIWEAYPGLQGSRFAEAYRRVATEGVAETLLDHYPDHDRFYEVRVYPAQDGISVYFRDVTEREREARKRDLDERRWRSFVEASGQIVWRVNATGEADEPIPSWTAFTGQTEAEAAGMGWVEAVHPDDRAGLVAARARALATGRLQEVEYRLRRRDGAWRQVIGRGVPIAGPDGMVAELVGTATDITDLRRIEDRLELALQGTSDGLWDWDLTTGDVYHSPRWIAMLGFAPEEWESSVANWIAHVHPDDLAETEEHLRAYLAGEIAEYANTFRMRHKDGSWRWMLSRAKAVRDTEGRPLRMVGAHTDITEQKEAEAALREREAMLRRVQRVGRVGGFEIDLRTGVNRRSAEYMGL